jgi:hypothetical protein
VELLNLRTPKDKPMTEQQKQALAHLRGLTLAEINEVAKVAKAERFKEFQAEEERKAAEELHI